MTQPVSMIGSAAGTAPGRTGWMVTFADLLSLLLCFLVLAYALNAASKAEQEEGLSALRAVFGAGDVGQTEVDELPEVARGGNYWGTWLKARTGAIPALADLPVTVQAATATLELPGDPSALKGEDIAALVALLNASGAPVAIHAGAVSDDGGTGRAGDWAEAGRRAQVLAGRLTTAGLHEAPRIAISGTGPLLAVVIGREEP